MSEELNPKQSADFIKIGFDTCYNQMKSELAEKDKEIERLKEVLIKIKALSTAHVGSLVLYQQEMKAINGYCRTALGKDANDTDNNVGSMEKEQ